MLLLAAPASHRLTHRRPSALRHLESPSVRCRAAPAAAKGDGVAFTGRSLGLPELLPPLDTHPATGTDWAVTRAAHASFPAHNANNENGERRAAACSKTQSTAISLQPQSHSSRAHMQRQRQGGEATCASVPKGDCVVQVRISELRRCLDHERLCIMHCKKRGRGRSSVGERRIFTTRCSRSGDVRYSSRLMSSRSSHACSPARRNQQHSSSTSSTPLRRGGVGRRRSVQVCVGVLNGAATCAAQF